MKSKKSIFVCPTHGQLDEIDVEFLCNVCQINQAKIIDSLYVCPQCEKMLHPIKCRICEQDVSWQTPLKKDSSNKKINVLSD